MSSSISRVWLHGTLSMTVVLSGCQTTGGGAALGAGLGAGLGAIVGSQSGNAAEGALIGALAGAAVGAVASEVRQRQIANRATLDAEYRNSGMPVPTQSVAEIEHIELAASNLKPGDSVQVSGQYKMMNTPPGQQPIGTMLLKKGDTVLATSQFPLKAEGRTIVEMKMPLPADLSPGQYTVQVHMQNGGSVSSSEGQIYVA